MLLLLGLLERLLLLEWLEGGGLHLRLRLAHKAEATTRLLLLLRRRIHIHVLKEVLRRLLLGCMLQDRVDASWKLLLRRRRLCCGSTHELKDVCLRSSLLLLLLGGCLFQQVKQVLTHWLGSRLCYWHSWLSATLDRAISLSRLAQASLSLSLLLFLLFLFFIARVA